LKLEDWGLIEYESSVERQLRLLDEVAAGAEDRLILCTHPPIVTLGRGAVAEDLVGWRGAIFESSRGGRATYHGPNQLVIYPIMDLRERGRDVHAYLRRLETATVDALHKLGLSAAEARTTKMGELSLTGVWIGERKIASIGIAVRKWITYHGVAVNLFDDVSAFAGIRPCGFAADIMTSAERELGHAPDLGECKSIFSEAFLRGL
jgi:lipoyl(octanoyl) transferase